LQNINQRIFSKPSAWVFLGRLFGVFLVRLARFCFIADFIYNEDLKKLNEILDTLTANQKDLVNRVFFNGQSITSIPAVQKAY